MTLQQTDKLSGVEARRLSGFLRGKRTPANTLSFNALKGFAYSICCCPEMIQLSEWLPCVFDGEMAVFEQDSNLENINLIIRLYNQIAEDVMAGRAGLPSGASLSSTMTDNFFVGHPLHDWSEGFIAGLGLTIEYWEQLNMPDEIAASVHECWMLLGFFDDEKEARKTARRMAEEPFPGYFNDFAKSVRQYMPTLIKEHASNSRLIIEEVSSWPDVLSDVTDTRQNELFPDLDSPTTDPSGEQYYMYQANNAEYIQDRISFARQALAENPECIDALLLLADYEGDKKRGVLLQKAISLSERTFDEAYCKEHEGGFWGLHETRPYMDAMRQLALTYVSLKRLPEAIALEEKMLRLNPHDNQGNRHVLICHYIANKQYAEAKALLQVFAEDESAYMQFSRVLLSYIETGNSAESRRLRAEAKQYNKYVVRYLSGPATKAELLPDYYGIGDKNEAIIFAHYHQSAWRSVVGAIPWLGKK